MGWGLRGGDCGVGFGGWGLSYLGTDWEEVLMGVDCVGWE